MKKNQNNTQTKNPSPSQNPRKPPEVIYFLGKSLCHVQPTMLHVGKSNTFFAGSQVRRMVYRVPCMKSYHNTA